jgi:glycosyltransferase involved in cell wall biosynthesis
MMKAPLVSILIPAFNAQEWIGDTLRSALAQTWPHKEIIVVDDGSTDQTVAAARQFEADGVRVVTQKNQGAAASRNNAFALSQGDYIQWLDADDLLAPDKIASQMQALEPGSSHRTLLSGGFGKFMYRWYRAQFIPTALWHDLSPAEWLIRKMGQNLYMQTATWLVSRELTEAAGPWNPAMLSDDDGEYFCRVLLQSDGTRFVPQARVYYRALGSDSLSQVEQSNRKLDALWDSMQLHIGYMRSIEDSPRSRAACLAYLQRRLIYFYPDRTDLVQAAERMAGDLGGQLAPPNLSWKYSWIKAITGWDLAQRASLLLRRSKASVKRWIDHTLFRMENRKPGEPVLNMKPQPVAEGTWSKNAHGATSIEKP